MVKPTERRVGYGVALGYGITDLFGGGAFAIIGTWLLFFYTTYCGLSVVEAGSIFAIARVIDAVLSPIMGNDSNLLIVFYVQIMPDDFVMQLHRF